MMSLQNNKIYPLIILFILAVGQAINQEKDAGEYSLLKTRFDWGFTFT